MGPLAPCIETYIRKLDPLKYRPEWVHMAYHLQGAYQHFGRYECSEGILYEKPSGFALVLIKPIRTRCELAFPHTNQKFIWSKVKNWTLLVT